MSNLQLTLLILAMALVTFLPRALPALLVGRLHFGARTEKFLRLIPYTAMTALIFPGLLTVDAARPWIGLVGGAVAAILAYFKCPLMLCVLAAIGSNFLIYLFV